LTAAYFEAAQVDFVPLSLRNIKLQKSDVTWSDIGGRLCILQSRNSLIHLLGLNQTRRVLRETLEWPTKYSPIFAQSPLRLRSG
jgi:peroxin-1